MTTTHAVGVIEAINGYLRTDCTCGVSIFGRSIDELAERVGSHLRDTWMRAEHNAAPARRLGAPA